MSHATERADVFTSAALAYAARGWPVLPLNGKLPRTPHGLKDATTDPDTLRAGWARWPEAGIGIRTGDGLVVLDVDGDCGSDSLHELERKHGELPATVEVVTGGGGRHVYFTHAGEPVRNSAGKLGPGLDVRGDGGYVAAPPSAHPSGRRYQWEVSSHPDDVELASAPTWLLERLSERPPNAGQAGEAIPAGQRNSALTRYAGAMRKAGMVASEIEAGLQEINARRCAPPLGKEEVHHIARSVAGYEPGENEEPLRLEVRTTRAVCELPDPPKSDELLGPLLARGSRLVLGGHTGEGKTTAGLAIVAAVACGESFLDWRGAGGRALVIDAEQGLKTIKRRLREAGLDRCEYVDLARTPDGLSLNSCDEHVAAVEEALTGKDYAVVLADPLYKLHSGDSNAEREAVDLMRRFDAWREQFAFALVLLVHCRKPPPGSKFTMHEFFGSSAYLRGAEVVVGLQRLRAGYSRLHFFKDRDGDLPVGEAWGLLFDREHGFRRDPDDGKPRETAPDKVRALLEEEPSLTEAQLREATGYAERTIRQALKALDAEYETGPDKTRYWSLPGDSEAAS
jgi:hypothetical protein